MSVRSWMAVAILAAMAAGAASAQDGAGGDALGERVVELRLQVDDVSAEINAMRAELASELRSIANRRADLELELARTESRIKSQRASMESSVEEIDGQAVLQTDLRPTLESSLTRVKASVDAGLPYKAADRRDAVEQIERDLAAGVLSPAAAVSRLWQFMEDELRLCGISELHQQTLVVDGQSFLADVVHLGMIELYFATEGGHVGRAVRDDTGYRFEFIDDDAEEEAVRKLFDRMRKQIRTGYVELPLQSVEGGAR